MSSPWLFPSVSVMLIPFAMLLSSCCTSVHGGKILLYPIAYGYSSHLMDMMKMAEIFKSRGHHVTFLINQEDRHLVEPLNTDILDFSPPEEVIHVDDVDYVRNVFLDNGGEGDWTFMRVMVAEHLSYCQKIVHNKELMMSLKQGAFDLLIVDLAENCGRILTNYLNTATIAYNPTGLAVEASFFPNMPSITPFPLSLKTGKPMNFWKRVSNTIMHCLGWLVVRRMWFGPFEQLHREYNMNSSLTLETTYVNKLILAMSNPISETKRPLLPNVISIGGWHIDKPKALNANLQRFIDGAGSDGFVLLSFGSLVRGLDPFRTAMIARVLAKLPQRIVWRFEGEAPAGIGKNTLLQDWIPQSDLLSQPNIKAFITHCGAHGSFEAIHYGVPVLACPLFGDQYEHAGGLVNILKMGLHIDMKIVTEMELLAAILDVINNNQYQVNAKKASVLLADQPISARDLLIHYVEYSMRHGTVEHLAMEALQTFSIAELYSFDVANGVVPSSSKS